MYYFLLYTIDVYVAYIIGLNIIKICRVVRVPISYKYIKDGTVKYLTTHLPK